MIIGQVPGPWTSGTAYLYFGGATVDAIPDLVLNGEYPGDRFGLVPDGFLDLALKFDKRAIFAALGSVSDGDVVELTVTGQLLDGTAFNASDCVRILIKGPVAPPSPVREIVLNGNVPKPFNPVTRISYVLPEEAHVSLAIYDVQGKLVERLVSGVMSAGEHYAEWDAKANPSGIYFVRLEVKNYKKHRKVILLK